MSELTIGFIGGGNMGSAMVAGLEKKHRIWISEPNPDSVKRLSALFPSVSVVSDNMELISNASLDVLVLAVKPQILKAVLDPLASKLVSKNTLILSIVAGIQIKDISKWSGCNAIVRVMPNTPALLNQGASGLYASSQVSDLQKKWAFEVMESISKKTYWLENESLIGNIEIYNYADVVTGISGSGPAYFFLLVQILTKVGVEHGLPYDVARGLASQTCLGAGSMLIGNEDESPEEFRRKVTSPNGTTQAGIDKMINLGIQDVFSKGIEAAIARSKELGESLGKL